MELTQMIYLDINKYLPEYDLDLIVKTRWGIRKAIRLSTYGIYKFTDCTHPMQNCHLSPYDILGWTYLDRQNMVDLKFTVNKFQHKVNGDEILNSITNKGNVFNKLSAFIKNIITKNKNH